MPTKTSTALLRLLSLSVTSSLFFSAAACAQGDNQIQALASTWSAQQSEIATGYFKYRLFRTGGDLAPLSCKQLRHLVESVNLAAHPDQLKTVIDGAQKTPIKAEPPWSVFESFFEGQKVRENDKSGASSIQVYDGDEKIEYDMLNKHVTLLSPGISKRYVKSLREFRFVPNPSPESYSIQDRGPSLISLRQGSSTLVVDGSTGAVHRYTASSADGKVTREISQSNFVTYPGGIIFPSLRIESTYDGSETLQWISISWIEEARFNTDLPKETFALSLPANTKILDERDSEHVRTFRTNEQISDVVAYIRSQIQPETLPARSRFSMWWVLAASALAIMVVLGVWRRRRIRTAG